MKLGQLAEALGLPLHGDGSLEVTALATLERAGPTELAFVVDQRYSAKLQHCRAGALIVPPSIADGPLPTGNYLISSHPYASYAKASWLLKPADPVKPGIHPSAVIDPGAQISPLAQIDACAVIKADCRVEDHVCIGSHCVLGEQTQVGEYTRLFAGVRVYSQVSIGRHCRIQSGAVLGAEGFGFAPAPDDQGWLQIQQTGGLRIGNRVHIGANTTIDCGAIEATVIADGVIIDNQVQIAHNVHIGENTAIAGCVGIAGSTRIGRHCQIGGACNIVGHLEIADGVILNAASLVTRSIKSAGRYGSGTPLLPEHAWRRSFVNLAKLDDLMKRLKRVERNT